MTTYKIFIYNLISFIPRTKDIIPGGVNPRPIPASLTDLPVSEATWGKISKAFWLLPSHIFKAIRQRTTTLKSASRTFIHDGVVHTFRMVIATASGVGTSEFAIAATYIEKSHLSLGIIIGCSAEQIERVNQLLKGSRHAIRHPLLMLGVCVELHFDRFKNRVYEASEESTTIEMWLDLIGNESGAAVQRRHEGITPALINRVRACRYKSRGTEEELKAMKRELSLALGPMIGSPVNSTEISHSDEMEDVGKVGDGEYGSIDSNKITDDASKLDGEGEEETTEMFKERFADIYGQFDGLIAKCSIISENMSFAADMVRVSNFRNSHANLHLNCR